MFSNFGYINGSHSEEIDTPRNHVQQIFDISLLKSAKLYSKFYKFLSFALQYLQNFMKKNPRCLFSNILLDDVAAKHR